MTPQQLLYGAAPPQYPVPPQRQSYGQPSAYGQPQGYQPAPSVCLRCYVPLYPGYTKCTNCGYDNSAAWGAAPAASPRTSMLPIALAIVGVALLVGAALLVLVAGGGGGSASSPIAIESPTAIVVPGLTMEAAVGLK